MYVEGETTMTSRTASRPKPERTATFWSRIDWRWVIIPAICVFAAIVTGLVNTTPKVVHQLTFDNAGPYAMNVEVSGATHDGWLALGTVAQRSTATIEDVIDQHGTWVFRFSSQGADGGSIEVSRKDLAANGWHLTIPATVANSLQSRGVPQTP
jgi:hypothetical protein